MSILKTAIVLLGVAVLLPTPPDGERQTGVDAAYVQVATRTFTDLAAFCRQKPEACEAAGHIARGLEVKAKYGIRLVYRWVGEPDPTTL